ncbi:hypothetical protein E2C01_080226 [Portunus trituberculatus]|uniref:Uncharacterized protein n=1 Tax=Portunus trituberculatus TaxID=210409 RepID=A0A5B7IXU9_PORTR|nr:hypothetical protein [Portunus trituberculatus]
MKRKEDGGEMPLFLLSLRAAPRRSDGSAAFRDRHPLRNSRKSTDRGAPPLCPSSVHPYIYSYIMSSLHPCPPSLQHSLTPVLPPLLYLFFSLLQPSSNSIIRSFPLLPMSLNIHFPSPASPPLPLLMLSYSSALFLLPLPRSEPSPPRHVAPTPRSIT